MNAQSSRPGSSAPPPTPGPQPETFNLKGIAEKYPEGCLVMDHWSLTGDLGILQIRFTGVMAYGEHEISEFPELGS